MSREKYINQLWEIVETPNRGFRYLFSAMEEDENFSWSISSKITEISIKFHGQEYFDVCKLMACFLLAEEGEL